jgi:hypothetical protein
LTGLLREISCGETAIVPPTVVGAGVVAQAARAVIEVETAALLKGSFRAGSMGRPVDRFSM